MTPARIAAEQIYARAFGARGDEIGLADTFATIIEEAYAERERAVAELVRLAELRRTELAKHCSGDNSCCFGCQELNALNLALAAVEGKQ